MPKVAEKFQQEVEMLDLAASATYGVVASASDRKLAMGRLQRIIAKSRSAADGIYEGLRIRESPFNNEDIWIAKRASATEVSQG